MMMKLFSSLLRRIGAIDLWKRIMWMTLMSFLVAIQCTVSFGKDVSFMTRYKLDDFLQYFGQAQASENANALYHTILVSDLYESNIRTDSFFERFSAYNVLRERSEGLDFSSKRYVAYDLTDQSVLFIFIEGDMLTSAYRMIPRCTAKEFHSIMQGISTPYDVVEIDANAVFNPFIQWGPVSYHCLDDGSFRQVTYMQSDRSTSEFVVKNVATISQKDCLSVLSDICLDDMP